MAKQTVTLKVSSEKELTAALVDLSKKNPGKAVTCYARFGTFEAYIYPSVSRISVDQADTRQMLATYKAIAFVNGKLVQPTKGWTNRQIAYDLRTND